MRLALFYSSFNYSYVFIGVKLLTAIRIFCDTPLICTYFELYYYSAQELLQLRYNYQALYIIYAFLQFLAELHDARPYITLILISRNLVKLKFGVLSKGKIMFDKKDFFSI